MVVAVCSYQINEKLDVSGTFVYGTGNAISLPLQQYNGLAFDQASLIGSKFGYAGASTLDYYGTKNNARMPAYHRADIGLNYHKKKKWGEAIWNVSVYNAYNRRNPYFIYFETIPNKGRVAKQVSLFPILPSISYGFKF